MARKKVDESYDKTRQEFIYAAIDELMESGYSKFTLTNVAKRVGVSKAALYWYFPNKEKLIGEVADTIYNYNVKRVELIITAVEDPSERLRSIFVPNQDQESNNLCLLAVKIYTELLFTNNELKNKIQQGYEEYILMIAKIIEDGIRLGAFQSSRSSQELAKYIVGTFDGAAMQSMIFNQEPGDMFETMFEMTLSMLRSKLGGF